MAFDYSYNPPLFVLLYAIVYYCVIISVVIFLRLRNVKNKEYIINNSPFLIDNPANFKGCWHDVFGNFNPIYLEIGMGKGDFIIENARKYPDINFIGIEKYDSVIVRAIQKLDNCNLSNLKLIRMDAKFIEEVFSSEVDRIYLNFSDPWPKKRHIERRLTSTTFLKKYDCVFKSTKELFMKTDNISLFEFSLENLSKYGYLFEKVSLDLHNSDINSNVMTEYEKKFVEKGIKINYLVAKKSV